MGLFSGSKKTYVASSAYNLAGDEHTRPNYLKTTVSQAALAASAPFIGEKVVSGQLRGPAMSQRSFFRWADNHFPEGRMTGEISSKEALTAEAEAQIKALIQAPAGHEVEVTNAFVDTRDIQYWADYRMLLSHPDLYDTNWEADYDDEGHNLVIFLEDGRQLRYWLGFGYLKDAEYVIAYYSAWAPSDPAVAPYKGVVIHRIGSRLWGSTSALDNLSRAPGYRSEFFPVIGLRRWNKSIRHGDYASVFPAYDEAYSRSVGGSFDELLDSVEENKDIGDIDHAFLLFGTEVNTEEPDSLRYIFEMFREFSQNQNGTEKELRAWANQTGYKEYLEDLNRYNKAHDPKYPRPSYNLKRQPGYSNLVLSNNNGVEFRAEIRWLTIDEKLLAGKGRSGAVKGDFWWSVRPNIQDPIYEAKTSLKGVEGMIGLAQAGLGETENQEVEHVQLFWQVSRRAYRRLDIYGMSHSNKVYKGKSVITTLKEGVSDLDTSGFVVPLHYDTMRKMPIVAANQFAISNKVLIFNSYKTVKKKWWQKGFFKILVAVVAVVGLNLLVPGLGGILGANLAVGATLGFTGITAVLIGAIANAAAAVVLSTLVLNASQDLLGDEIGAIVAAVVMLAVGSYAAGYQSTGSFAINWSEMLKMDNLMRITEAVAKGVSNYNAARIEDMQNDLVGLQNEFEAESRRISDLWEGIGYSGVVLDPLSLFEERQDSATIRTESPSTFLRRTLMTGSDLVDLDHTLISEFPTASLVLPKYTL